MHAAPKFLVAKVILIMAGKFLVWLIPFLALAAMILVVRRMDQIMDRLFPHWEWEKQLGWLNIRAQRQADAVMRWLGYFVYAVLAVALLGIPWAAEALASLDRLDDPQVMADVTTRVPVLLACLGLWLLFLGCELIPKLRGKWEMDALNKFRAEQEVIERERELARVHKAASRLKSIYNKPGWDQPSKSPRMRPGG